MKRFEKLLSVLLVLCMVLAMVPAQVFAVEEPPVAPVTVDGPDGTEETLEETPEPVTPSTVAITVTATAGGSFTLSENVVDGKVAFGEEVTLNVEADDKYQIASVSGVTAKIEADKTKAEATFKADKDTAIEVVFVKSNTVTISYDGSGNPVLAGAETVSNGTVAVQENGADVDVTITPAEGYRLENVKITGGDSPWQKYYTDKDTDSNALKKSLKAGRSYELLVTFTLKRYTITTTVNDPAAGTAETYKKTALHGSKDTLTIKPAAGKEIKSVTINPGTDHEVVVTALTEETDTQATYTINNITADQNIVVEFTDLVKDASKVAGVLNVNSALKVETDENGVRNYFFHTDGKEAYFSTKKDGIRVYLENGDVLGGNQKQEAVVKSTSVIKKVQLRYQAPGCLTTRWHEVTSAAGIKVVIDKDAPVVTITAPEVINGFHKINENGKVVVGVKVTEKGDVSGITGVSYRVKDAKGENKQGGNLTLDQEGKAVINVSAQDCNGDGMELIVTAKDTAGNVTNKTLKLNIDNTAPKVKVTYDNDNVKNGTFFKATRTATITITERESGFVAPKLYVNTKPAVKDNYISVTVNGVAAYAGGYSIGNKDKKILATGDAEVLSVSKWTTEVDEENLDKTTHTVTITYLADADYEFDVKITDKSGKTNAAVNYGDSKVPTAFTVDTTAPTGKVEYMETGWSELLNVLSFGIVSNEKLEIWASWDKEVNPDTISYYVHESDGTALSDTELDQKTFTKTHPTIPISIAKNQRYVVYVKLMDKAGNYTYISTNGMIFDDGTEDAVSVEALTAPDGINSFYTKDFDVKFTVNDTETGSGIQSVDYKIMATRPDGERIETKKLENLFTFDKVAPAHNELVNTFEKTVTVIAAESDYNVVDIILTVTDRAGNTKEDVLTVQIDTKAPTVSLSYNDAEAENTVRNEKYFGKVRTATVVVTERNANFIEPQLIFNQEADPGDANNYIYITAKNAKGEFVDVEPEIEWTHDYINDADSNNDTHTATIIYSEDANYTFDIKVTDAAGHGNDGIDLAENTKAYDIFTVDKTAPTGSITATTVEVDEETKNPVDTLTWENKLLGVDDFNLSFPFWAKEGIKITETDDDVTSPIESVQYYIQKHGANPEAVTLNKENIPQITEWKPFVEFTRLPNEKFTVYLKITDYAGNIRYISTDGLIADNIKPEGYNEKPEIDILPPDLPDGGSIYNTDEVQVQIKVKDPDATEMDKIYSGLKSVTYKVKNLVLSEAEQVTQTETFNFNPTELQQTFEYTIPVDSTKNNSNEVEIEVTAVDNAGNSRTSTKKIMIDTTVPQITVTYSPDPTSVPYTKETRTATIKVRERNFDKEASAYIVTAVHESPIQFSGWTKIETEKLDQADVAANPNGDYTIHQATITFEESDHYSLASVTTTDLAGNVATPYEKGSWLTVDKVQPKISVSYDNNNVANGKYFKANRTATITVEEHNFDPTKVAVEIKTDRGGVAPTTTGTSNWVSSLSVSSGDIQWLKTDEKGDIHVAKLAFAHDGDYIVDISATDLADNVDAGVDYGKSAAPKDFVIDTTYQDMITIEGVENGKAYGYDADVKPSIRIHDINLDAYNVTLVGQQKGKPIDLTDKANALLNKGTETVTGIFDLFAKEQNLDGIYTLTVTSKDKATNEDKEEIIFTVNRFGSVYVYDDYLKSLIQNGGTYVKKVEGDLIITEYNADKLLAGYLDIEITLDGKPLDKVDFTVSPEINDQVKPGESGWYQYKYTIKASNFASDGIYKVTVSSKDATGNTPANTNYEDMGIAFYVDENDPKITSITGLEKAQVKGVSKDVTFAVFDPIGLKSVEVLVNGERVAFIEKFEDINNYTHTFTLKEGMDQKIEIIVTDLAGNTISTNDESFKDLNRVITVSTNILILWYSNKPLFWGSIGGVVLLVAVIWFVIAWLRKKKEKK